MWDSDNLYAVFLFFATISDQRCANLHRASQRVSWENGGICSPSYSLCRCIWSECSQSIVCQVQRGHRILHTCTAPCPLPHTRRIHHMPRTRTWHASHSQLAVCQYPFSLICWWGIDQGYRRFSCQLPATCRLKGVYLASADGLVQNVPLAITGTYLCNHFVKCVVLTEALWNAAQEPGACVKWINSFPPQKCTFSPQSVFCPLFLNEDGRILKNCLSKLHYRFRRYSTLTKTVLLESQYLQSYGSLPDFLRQNIE